MAAALLLPGVVCTAVHAQTDADSVSLQAAQVREGTRSLPGIAVPVPALRADTQSLRSTSLLDGGGSLQLGYTQDTWSGATPISTAPVVAQGNRPLKRGGVDTRVTTGASPMVTGSVLLDAGDRPVARDAAGRLQPAPDLVHTLSSASPETRQQLDLKWTRPLGAGSLSLGAGASLERDHRTRFASLGRRIDDGLSTWTFGAAVSRSDVAAVLDHDAAPYLTKSAYRTQIENRNGQQVLTGRRDEQAVSVGWARVLGPSAVLESSLSYTRIEGYLGNPYKAVSVIFAPLSGDGTTVRGGDLQALLEQRPGQRRQWNMATRLVLHHAPADAALHLGYGAYADDWGVRVHRMDGEWFQPIGPGNLLSLRLRYHTQQAARFYTPYLVTHQAYRSVSIGPDGQPVVSSFDPARLPATFSSDQRLAGFGVLGAGIGWTRRFDGGLTMDLSLDHSTQAGRLKWGGGGEGRYADLRYLLAQASLSFEFGARLAAASAAESAHDGHAAAHATAAVPAEVMAAHLPASRGEVMVGYRQQWARQAGPMQQGGTGVDDLQVLLKACGSAPCSTRPTSMTMRMQMLDLMVGLGGGWSLMVMPQWLGMAMDNQLLAGAAPSDVPPHLGLHESAGLGDTQVHALLHAAGSPTAPWLLGLGLSVPTGDTGLHRRRMHQQDGAALDYAMQTGTGTWDLLPSLTHVRSAGRWSWGGQFSAAVRLQTVNDDGYAWGPRWQATAWVGHHWAPQLASTLRLAVRREPGVIGARTLGTPVSSPAERASNHGGRFSELGAGLTYRWAAETRLDTQLSLEAVLPLHSQVQGFQLAPRRRWILAVRQAL